MSWLSRSKNLQLLLGCRCCSLMKMFIWMLVVSVPLCIGFSIPINHKQYWNVPSSYSLVLSRNPNKIRINLSSSIDNINQQQWEGDVVEGGMINGCSITPVEGTLTEYMIAIDGVEADLGRFSLAIYNKIIKDAKQQRFQGFRPGTIPVHLEPTYRIFSMDECCRETILEAMQQNKIRPFDKTRFDLKIENISFEPKLSSSSKKKGSKKKNSKKNKDNIDETQTINNEKDEEVDNSDIPVASTWVSYNTIKDAIDAGWKPGQSFSFIATNCQGQKVKDSLDVAGSKPLGLNY